MDNSTLFMPDPASTIAPAVDDLWYFIFWVSVFFFTLIVTIAIVFAIRYRRRNEHDTTPHLSHSLALEIGWSIIPIILIVVMFVWGFDTYMQMRVPPADALEIRVTAEKWNWKFTYPDGTVTGELSVPVNTPVRLVMSSKDVIHSFFVPHFRLKMDVLPNRYTTTWFEATKTGEFPIFCAEYCGTQHSGMLSTVLVQERPAHEEWLMTGGIGDISGLPLAEQGGILFRSPKFACHTCHSTDGTVRVGPSLANVFNHEVALSNGSSVLADENYLRESILNPQAKVVAGYPPTMPTYQGVIQVEELDAIIEFIKSLE